MPFSPGIVSVASREPAWYVSALKSVSCQTSMHDLPKSTVWRRLCARPAQTVSDTVSSNRMGRPRNLESFHRGHTRPGQGAYPETFKIAGPRQSHPYSHHPSRVGPGVNNPKA